MIQLLFLFFAPPKPHALLKSLQNLFCTSKLFGKKENVHFGRFVTAIGYCRNQALHYGIIVLKSLAASNEI